MLPLNWIVAGTGRLNASCTYTMDRHCVQRPSEYASESTRGTIVTIAKIEAFGAGMHLIMRRSSLTKVIARVAWRLYIYTYESSLPILQAVLEAGSSGSSAGRNQSDLFPA
jgi:hypothetical protein